MIWNINKILIQILDKILLERWRLVKRCVKICFFSLRKVKEEKIDFKKVVIRDKVVNIFE